VIQVAAQIPQQACAAAAAAAAAAAGAGAGGGGGCGTAAAAAAAADTAAGADADTVDSVADTAVDGSPDTAVAGGIVDRSVVEVVVDIEAQGRVEKCDSSIGCFRLSTSVMHFLFVIATTVQTACVDLDTSLAQLRQMDLGV